MNEEQKPPAMARLMRLALENMIRVLSMPVPESNDTSAEAQLVRALMTAVAAIAHFGRGSEHSALSAKVLQEIAAFRTVH
jgi:hypothetical protein